MFTRLVGESFVRNPRRSVLTAAALVVGMAVATATLTVALEVGDRMAREFRSLGANLLVTPQSDSLPLEIGGVDYRPVDEGAYLQEANLGKIKTIFWRHNVLGFTPFLDVPVSVRDSATPESSGAPAVSTTLIGTWYEHPVAVPDGSTFATGAKLTHPWWKIQGTWFHDASAAVASSAGEGPADAAANAGLLGGGSLSSKIKPANSALPRAAALPRVVDVTSSEAVVGASFASAYPGGITPGKTIYVSIPGAGNDRDRSKQIALRVTGIVTTGDAEDQAIVVPLSVAQALSGHPGEFRQLFVSALTKPADSLSERDPQSLTPTEYDRWFCSPYISSISYQIGQVLPGTDIHAIRRVADSEGKILSHVSTLLWIVTLAALLAAALAVAATSATTVLQRRAEIGIMKAIGATNALVGGIFLVEQLLLALAGGAVGFALGLLLARILGSSVFGTPAEPRLVLLPIILALAAVVSIAGSLIPLRRAAHFNPAPILRGE
jgi:putative ABC transport system permease protein